MARYIDPTERKRVCCNCGRNIRTPKRTHIECICEIDGHYIGYVECMTGWCRHWKKGKWLLEKIYEDEHGIEEFNYFCSECGAPAYEFSQPYCHRCGAKMRKTEAKYEQEALSRL